MKKKIMLIVLFSFFLIPTKSLAKEIYYTNDHGVSFSKEEYDFLTNMFWDGSQELFTLSDYDRFIASNIINGEFDMIIYDNPMPKATEIKDSARTLKIARSCSSDCFVSVTLKWTSSPTIRSYDVIGAYLDGTSVKNTPSTVAASSSETKIEEALKKESNGFGASIKLPSGSSVTINQAYRVEKQGTVYASYQHAMAAITLEHSQQFTISRVGYGSVFKFTGIAAETYDRMNGVNIAMS